jgi:ferredoxin-NADP reductase
MKLSTFAKHIAELAEKCPDAEVNIAVQTHEDGAEFHTSVAEVSFAIRDRRKPIVIICGPGV